MDREKMPKKNDQEMMSKKISHGEIQALREDSETKDLSKTGTPSCNNPEKSKKRKRGSEIEVLC